MTYATERGAAQADHNYVVVYWLIRTPIREAPGRNGRKKEGPMTSIKTITQMLGAWRRYRDVVRELSAMSDRELSDIGLNRYDIGRIARESAAA
jgi:uncharacterized protein YjiS (DUF1127 family)